MCAMLAGSVAGQGIPWVPPYIDAFHGLDQDAPPRLRNFGIDGGGAITLRTTLFRDTAAIDFERRQITFMRIDKWGNFPVWVYHYDELEEYLAGRQRFAIARLWHEGITPQTERKKSSENLPALDFSLPVNYPAWARRVLGREPPRLTIKGYQAFTLALRSFKKTIGGQQLRDSQQPGLQPDFNQENAFNITGSIGRLIKVQIKAGSGAEFENISDQLKDFKIEYREDSIGELEDEVVQEVVAGFTNFEMPGAGLSGYSESAEGLFGIKVKSKIGPLMLTTIVSHEKGEVQKDTLDLSGGGGDNKLSLRERDYAQNRYFFLDSAYLQKYNGVTTKAPEVTHLEIYRWINPSEERNKSGERYISAYFGSPVSEMGNFVLLTVNRQYYLNQKDGWIRFADSVSISDDDIIAIIMRTADSSVVAGKGDATVIQVDTAKVVKNLWVLKDRLPKEDNPTFHLMWRNAYKVNGNPPVENLSITIFRKDANPPTEKFEGRYFTDILGLTNNGKFLKTASSDADGLNAIYDNLNGYLIIVPTKTGNNTVPVNWPFANPALGATSGLPNVNKAIYTTGRSEPAWNNTLTDVFEITLIGASARKTVFSLGWGITPGTERVIKDGSTVLTVNRDYTIDYESGTLELVSGAAKAATRLEAEYQREAMFAFDRKSFLGMHGKIDLPNVGRDSYIGTSVLFQSTTKGRKMPTINQIPFNKLLLGANTKLDFEPEWMTQLVNAIPLVKTDAPSSITFDAEIAHSSMIPNAGTQASIENFEASSQVYDLGVGSANRWFRSSPPIDFAGADDKWDSLYYHPPAWWWYWYNPERSERERSRDTTHWDTKRTDIWHLGKDDYKTTDDNLIRTLRLWVQPAPDNGLAQNYVNPWAGIMTTIPSTLADRTDDRYLEIWLKDPKDGVLSIDMGSISEDVCISGGPPNRREDREDPDRSYGSFYDSLDRGLDGRWDKDEYWCYPNLSGATPRWDTLFPGRDDSLLERFVKDPARDNWRGSYRRDSLSNREWINGLQGDKVKEAEDLNDDNFSSNEAFFRARIDFSNVNASPYIDRSISAKGNWRLFRIPLNDSTKLSKIVGKPSWDKITFVRLVWSDFKIAKTKAKPLEFAVIQFVGNQWRPHGRNDSIKIEASEINSKDNRPPPELTDPVKIAAYYTPPAPVQQQLDYEKDQSEVAPEEHALRLNYHSLQPGEVAYVERFFNSNYEIDLSPYDTLQMFVKDQMRIDPSTWFIFRFGFNDSTYYEYRTRNLFNAWNGGIAIDLRRFSTLKLDYLNNAVGERAVYDTSLVLPGGSTYRIWSTTKTPPSLSKVQWMAIGVARDKNAFGTDAGELWVDDINISGLKSLTGLAFRGNLSTRWADFMDLSADVRYDDADFRQMAENQLTPRDSRLSSALNAQWSLNKFLPADLGISVPLGASVTSSLGRPKVRPESDIYLVDKDNNADDLGDMAGDFVDQLLPTHLSKTRTEAENFEKETVSRTWYSSYSKNSISENPLANLTVDRISLDARYVRDSSITGRGRHPNPDSVMYRDVDARKTLSGTISYNLSPKKPPEWAKWKPFGNMKNKKIFPRLQEYELTFLPKMCNFKLATMSYSRSEHIETRRPENNLTKRQLDLSHGFQFSFEPIRPLLEMTYDIDLGRDLENEIDQWSGTNAGFVSNYIFAMDPTWKQYGVSYGEESRTQKAGFTLTPELADWLSNTGSYSVTYTQRPQQVRQVDTRFMSANTATQVSLASNLRLRNLVTSLVDITDKQKILKALFEKVDKGFNQINLNEFRFSYSASSNLVNEYLGTSLLSRNEIGAAGFLNYQLGFRQRSLADIVGGDMDDALAFGGMRSRSGGLEDSLELWKNDRRETRQEWSIKTDLRLPDPLDFSFNPISLTWGHTFSVKPTYYANFIDTVYTFPQVEVGLTSGMLQRITLIKNAMTSLRLNSTFVYARRTKISSPLSADAQAQVAEEQEYGLNPLISLNGTVKKWPIDISYRHTFKYLPRYSWSRPANDETATREVTSNHGNNWTLAYKARASKLTEIKILRWKIPIKGELNIGMEATHTHDKTQGTLGTLNDLTSIEVSPHVSYYFTNNVLGKAEFLYRQTNDRRKSEEKETETAFSLTVRIDF
jgi:hypothetical protein